MLVTYLRSFFTSKKSKYLFLRYHFLSIFIFGLLYWGQDNFVTYYPKISNNIDFGKAYTPPDSLFDWLWFSAVTQTTVGYDRLSDGGESLAFNKIQNKAFKFINFVQVCSIFILASLVF